MANLFSIIGRNYSARYENSFSKIPAKTMPMGKRGGEGWSTNIFV